MNYVWLRRKDIWDTLIICSNDNSFRAIAASSCQRQPRNGPDLTSSSGNLFIKRTFRFLWVRAFSLSVRDQGAIKEGTAAGKRWSPVEGIGKVAQMLTIGRKVSHISFYAEAGLHYRNVTHSAVLRVNNLKRKSCAVYPNLWRIFHVPQFSSVTKP